MVKLLTPPRVRTYYIVHNPDWVGDGGRMAERMDAQWMERVLESHLIIRGSGSRTKNIEFLLVGAQPMVPRSGSVVDHELLVVRYSSPWPQSPRMTAPHEFRPKVHFYGPFGAPEYERFLEGRINIWEIIDGQSAMARQTTLLNYNGQPGWHPMFAIHGAMLAVALSYTTESARGTNMAQLLEIVSERFDRFLDTQMREASIVAST